MGNSCKSVKKALRKVRQQMGIRPVEAAEADSVQAACEATQNYHLYANIDLDGIYRQLDAYQKKRHGCNWMTAQYFETMKQASADPNINFKLHSIELYDGPVNAAPSEKA